jgi:hypothetical protein
MNLSLGCSRRDVFQACLISVCHRCGSLLSFPLRRRRRDLFVATATRLTMPCHHPLRWPPPLRVSPAEPTTSAARREAAVWRSTRRGSAFRCDRHAFKRLSSVHVQVEGGVECPPTPTTPPDSVCGRALQTLPGANLPRVEMTSSSGPRLLLRLALSAVRAADVALDLACYQPHAGSPMGVALRVCVCSAVDPPSTSAHRLISLSPRYELARPAAGTRMGEKRIRTVRTMG